MLTTDEVRGLRKLVERGIAGGGHGGLSRAAWRCQCLGGLLSDTLAQYGDAEHHGEPLGCLANAAHALAGALRERLAGE